MDHFRSLNNMKTKRYPETYPEHPTTTEKYHKLKRLLVISLLD